MTTDRLTVQTAEAGLRLDRFLTHRCPGRSRAYLQKLIRDGRVTLAGEPVKASRPMAPGDTVEVAYPELVPLDLTPEAIPISILFEDAHLLVIDKPAGIAVHPGAGLRRGTLVHALLHHCRDLSGIGGVERPGIVHRLDKETSGVLVVAKNDAAHRGLADQFSSRSVTKIYEAVVWGRLQKSAGAIDLPIGRDRVSRVKISTRTDAPRQAFTDFRVKERFAGFTWIEVRPRTGRTHQIRVHLGHLGHPIVGDVLYGGSGRRPAGGGAGLQEALAGFHRLALHAARIAFTHPATGEPVSFEAPLPAEITRLIDLMRGP